MENYSNENFGSVKPKNSSEEAVQRWRRLYGLVKNRNRRFCKIADLVKRSEAEDKKRKIQEKIRVALYVQKAARQYIGKSDLEEESLREHLLTEAAEAGRNQESIDDVGSTDNRTSVSKLLDKYKKCALALFYVLLEAASLSLDIAGKMKWRILLAAFVLSAFSFAISLYTCIMRRIRAATRVHWQTQLVRMVEISFSVVQLVVTLANFILAELGVKNKFDASVLPLVFSIIVAAFNIIYVRDVSDSSGLASSLMASAADIELQDLQDHNPNTVFEDAEANGSLSTASVADHQLQNIQVHNPSIIAEDVEANGSLSMASCADHQLQNIQVHNPSTTTEDAEADSSLSMAPAAGLPMQTVHMPNNTRNEDAEANNSMPIPVIVTSRD
ncbi:hypothetical protein AB3S75_013409 [Citrus x aurantiifolia]